jgi:hypothetical protein
MHQKQPIKTKANCLAQEKNRGAHGLKAQSMSSGNRGQGTGDREQGTGNREQGTGNRGQGTGKEFSSFS